MVQKIIDIYLNKGINIGQYEEVCMGSIGFSVDTFQDLLSLLKQKKIIIQKIELFEKNTLNFIPPDFWSTDENLDENYAKVDNFLESIKNNMGDDYLTVTFQNQDLEDEINMLLKDKYSIHTTEEEKLKRKGLGWEFFE